MRPGDVHSEETLPSPIQKISNYDVIMVIKAADKSAASLRLALNKDFVLVLFISHYATALQRS